MWINSSQLRNKGAIFSYFYYDKEIFHNIIITLFD